MAHGLTEPTIAKVHQALHGYADGHRQIALSVELKPRDQKTLLALSDISGIGATLDEHGYLTGYPLTDSGYYALARTWPAPEMPRPGCVWTQTLLIDFNDVAALRSGTDLIGLFRRPSAPSDFHTYSKPKRLQINLVQEGGLVGQNLTWASSVLRALYDKPKSRVVASRGALLGLDHVVLAIWLQQWPRLRRSFRFCTLATSDRSTEGSDFDLQILPSVDRSVRSRFSGSVDPSLLGTTYEVWLEDAINDLEIPDYDKLRSFLRKLGSEISAGRDAFRPLCLIHHWLTKVSKGSTSINEAVKILNTELGMKQTRMARVLVTEAALENVSSLDGFAFDFLWKNLHLIDPIALHDAASRVGRALLHRDPQKLSEIASIDSAQRVIVDGMLTDLSMDELLACVSLSPKLMGEVIKRRPEIVGDSRLYASDRELDSILNFAKESGFQSEAIKAMFLCERRDLPKAAIRAFGEAITLGALNQINLADLNQFENWVSECAKTPGAVAEFLAGQHNVQQIMLYALARAILPDTVPNEHGTDPWLLGWNASTGTLGETEKAYVLAFLLSRALGRESKSQAELAELSFGFVHEAVAIDNLPTDGWRVLEPRLPWSLLWPSWDRCRRVRGAVVNLFVDRDLPPQHFARLTKSGDLFVELMEATSFTFRGRAYLKRVLVDLAGAEDPFIRDRSRIVSAFLDTGR